VGILPILSKLGAKWAGRKTRVEDILDTSYEETEVNPSPVGPRILCDNAHVTIWRPGLLTRPTPRWSERALSLVYPAVNVEDLAAMVVEDVMQSLGDQRGIDEQGALKVVGSNSVVVWAKMRRLSQQKVERQAP
jgi:hypothetical protein